ncbi:MAG: hypothetical protein ACR2PQ_08460 [Myxococcota bacterium]
MTMQRCTTSRVAAAGFLLAFLVCASQASARQETLRWTHPDSETVDRFEVHWGLASRLYTSTVDVGIPQVIDGVFTQTLTVTPDDAVVFFAVTAVDATYGASQFSNERSRDEEGNPALFAEGSWGSVVTGTETFSVKKVGKVKLPTDWVFAFGTGDSNSFAVQDAAGQTYSGTFVTGGKKGQKLTLTLDSISRTNLAAVLNDELALFEKAPPDASIQVDTSDLKAKLKSDGERLSIKGKLKLLMTSPSEGTRKGRLKLKHEGAVVIVE